MFYGVFEQLWHPGNGEARVTTSNNNPETWNSTLQLNYGFHFASYENVGKSTWLHSEVFGALLMVDMETTQSAHRSKVNAVGMDYLRGRCGVKWIDRVRNDEVRRRCGVSRSVITELDRAQLRWYGHIERIPGTRYTKQIYQGEVVGTRPISRPKKSWWRAGRTE